VSGFVSIEERAEELGAAAVSCTAARPARRCAIALPVTTSAGGLGSMVRG
jgi:hypothetical protein